jgi:hypothetical protein
MSIHEKKEDLVPARSQERRPRRRTLEALALVMPASPQPRQQRQARLVSEAPRDLSVPPRASVRRVPPLRKDSALAARRSRSSLISHLKSHDAQSDVHLRGRDVLRHITTHSGSAQDCAEWCSDGRGRRVPIWRNGPRCAGVREQVTILFRCTRWRLWLW